MGDWCDFLIMILRMACARALVLCLVKILHYQPLLNTLCPLQAAGALCLRALHHVQVFKTAGACSHCLPAKCCSFKIDKNGQNQCRRSLRCAASATFNMPAVAFENFMAEILSFALCRSGYCSSWALAAARSSERLQALLQTSRITHLHALLGAIVIHCIRIEDHTHRNCLTLPLR